MGSQGPSLALVLDLLKVYNLCLVLSSLLKLFQVAFGLFAPPWVLKAISWVLPKSCPDSPVPAVGPPGALMLICACTFHATCLSIYLKAGLGLGASCWHVLGVVCLWGLGPFILVSFSPCTQLSTAPMPSCARRMLVSCLVGIQVACLGVKAFCCLKIVVAGCWLCHFGPCPAVGLPRGLLVAS